MKFLFSHRNFPAQFRHIITELGKDPKNEVVFLTGTRNLVAIQGVTKLLYKTKRRVPENSHRYLKMYEDSIIHGQAAAEAARSGSGTGIGWNGRESFSAWFFLLGAGLSFSPIVPGRGGECPSVFSPKFYPEIRASEKPVSRRAPALCFYSPSRI